MTTPQSSIENCPVTDRACSGNLSLVAECTSAALRLRLINNAGWCLLWSKTLKQVLGQRPFPFGLVSEQKL
jgi:hypothetical protein